MAPIVGHVGDGNFHVLVLMDMDDPAEVARAEEFVSRLNMRAIAMEGTCTASTGSGRARCASSSTSLDAVDYMRAIKAALDPLGILNPGKIVGRAG